MMSIGADVDKDQERRNPHGAWKKEEEEGKKRRRKRKKRREEQAGQPRGRSDRATDRTGRRRGRSDRATDRAHPGIVPKTNRTEICEVSGLRPVDRTRDRTIRSTARSDRPQTGSVGFDPPTCTFSTQVALYAYKRPQLAPIAG
jgi:hypothetical protein